jgi:hypothetical protein
MKKEFLPQINADFADFFFDLSAKSAKSAANFS